MDASIARKREPDEQFGLDGWEAGGESPAERAASETLILALGGFEGPLDLLLALAKTQKLDLAKISILDLVNQYLDFINAAKRLRLEIAGDYLVMAAWLAYLKSKMLLPDEPKAENSVSGQDMAAQLAFRLQRLEAMRGVVGRIFARKQLGVDFFARGMPEAIRFIKSSVYQASVFDLLKAYTEQRKREAHSTVKWGGRVVWSIRKARERLTEMIGDLPEWEGIDHFLEEYLNDVELNKTVTASTLGATLELAREGYIEIRQAEPFGPIYLRWLGRPKKPDGTPQDTPQES